MILQNSFATEDTMDTMKFRDTVDKRADGWTMAPLLPQACDDSDWLPRWREDLRDGALVVFSESYRQKIANPAGALRKEAAAIREKLEHDADFHLFVLDPAKKGQGPADLVMLLGDKEQSMNKTGWLKFLDRLETAPCAPEAPAAGRSPGRSGSVRPGSKVYRIIVYGSVGTGKSSLINSILRKAGFATEMAQEGDAANGVTKEVKRFPSDGALRIVTKTSVGGIEVQLFDLPGLGDSDSSDVATVLKELQFCLAGEKPDALLICKDATNTRVNMDIDLILLFLKESFQDDGMWNCVVLVGTKKDIASPSQQHTLKNGETKGGTLYEINERMKEEEVQGVIKHACNVCSHHDDLDELFSTLSDIFAKGLDMGTMCAPSTFDDFANKIGGCFAKRTGWNPYSCMKKGREKNTLANLCGFYNLRKQHTITYKLALVLKKDYEEIEKAIKTSLEQIDMVAKTAQAGKRCKVAGTVGSTVFGGCAMAAAFAGATGPGALIYLSVGLSLGGAAVGYQTDDKKERKKIVEKACEQTIQLGKREEIFFEAYARDFKRSCDHFEELAFRMAEFKDDSDATALAKELFDAFLTISKDEAPSPGMKAVDMASMMPGMKDGAGVRLSVHGAHALRAALHLDDLDAVVGAADVAASTTMSASAFLGFVGMGVGLAASILLYRDAVEYHPESVDKTKGQLHGLLEKVRDRKKILDATVFKARRYQDLLGHLSEPDEHLGWYAHLQIEPEASAGQATTTTSFKVFPKDIMLEWRKDADGKADFEGYRELVRQRKGFPHETYETVTDGEYYQKVYLIAGPSEGAVDMHFMTGAYVTDGKPADKFAHYSQHMMA